MNAKVATPRPPTLADAMTLVPFVVRPDDSLMLAHRIMTERGIRHLPVVREGELVGLLSQRDVLSRSTREAILRVQDAMAHKPFSVDVSTPLRDVVAVMASRKLGSAVVMQSGRVVGVFTTVDALRLLAGVLL